MNKKIATAASYLHALLSLIWIGLSIAIIVLNPTLQNLIVYILMIFNSLAYTILYIGLKQRNRLIYILAIAYNALNLILTLTDQFGVLDIIVLILYIITLALLILSRKEFKS